MHGKLLGLESKSQAQGLLTLRGTDNKSRYLAPSDV